MAFAFVPSNPALQTVDLTQFVYPVLTKIYTDRVSGTRAEEIELRVCSQEDLDKFYPLAESQA